MNSLIKAVDMARRLLEQIIMPGDRVIDATMGNGSDTLFLAEQVGPNGMVYAFDIQEDALLYTKSLLEKHNCLAQVKLINDNHDRIDLYVREKIKAATFNLGYLPGGNKKITTQKKSTIDALEKCMKIICPGGAVCATAYPGHAGGEDEAAEAERMFSVLPSNEWLTYCWKRLNQTNKAPYLLFAQRLAKKGGSDS